MFDRWVIDAGASNDEMLCFCPMVGEDILIGVSVISGKIPNGEFVGIYHEDGDVAANNWYHKHYEIVESYICEAKMDGRKFVKPDYITA